MMRHSISMFTFTAIVFMNFQSIAQESIHQFIHQTDVGNVKHEGSTVYNFQSQKYQLEGSGSNIWFNSDEFHFVYFKVSGDFIVRGNMNFVGIGTDPHRKIGWMIRNDLTISSAYVSGAIHGDGLVSLQHRHTAGGETSDTTSTANHADILQLERQGNRFIMSAGRHGETLTETAIELTTINDEAYLGMYICSHNADIVEKAIYSNVRFIKPALDDVDGYEKILGSNLEIMNVETGDRKILHTVPNSIQAPNWTPDGKKLIYNSEGLLYEYTLETDEIKVLDTDFAKDNNNDHVISFDGKQMAISHRDEKLDASVIYTLPLTGGEPKQVTPKGPSYLHGWSADDKKLVYCASRNDQYDVYEIDIATQQEVQLTNEPGLDDGPEYTPDGKYIYFNSNRTGTMQIWRMNPDGTNPQQLTNDKYNDWFAHISPNGKQMVYISYPPSVPSGDHPYYKRVMLRLSSIEGGTPRVVAYLYGGQGTMNVPSWSPDSKYIAFVSNSGHLSAEEK
jgi:TolB protein